MNKLIGAVAAAVLLLNGCASLCPCADNSPSVHPVVLIEGGRPVVVPDPLHFLKSQQNLMIVWHLPANAGLQFPPNGITIDGELTNKPGAGSDDKAAAAKGGVSLQREQTEIVDCKLRSELEFTCLNRHTRPGVFKYTVRVLQNGVPREADPQVMND